MNNPKYPTLTGEDEHRKVKFVRITENYAVIEVRATLSPEHYYQIWKKMDD